MTLDTTDFLYKNFLGRLGFDDQRPWYEEEQCLPTLMPASAIMCDRLPDVAKVPSLVRGGVVNLAAADTSYDTFGVAVSRDSVVTMRIRVPLVVVEGYTKHDGFYVYRTAVVPLTSSCPVFGYVVEVLKGDDISVSDETFSVLSGHVVFQDATWGAADNLYISFYEYTGRSGASAFAGTAAVTPTTTTRPPPSQESPLRTSDELVEGVYQLFFTEERLRSSLLKMTTDDITEGEITRNHREQLWTEMRSQMSKLELLKENVPVHLDELQESTDAMHFNRTRFKMYFSEFFVSRFFIRFRIRSRSRFLIRSRRPFLIPLMSRWGQSQQTI